MTEMPPADMKLVRYNGEVRYKRVRYNRGKLHSKDRKF